MNEFDDDFETDDDSDDDSPEFDDDEGTTPEQPESYVEDAISEHDKIEQQLKELEATPGFLEGKLRNSRNELDRQKHEEILRKRSELIKRQHEKPDIDADNLTPEGQARIRQELLAIESTPGFFEGRLRTSSNPADHELHKELIAKRTELISRLLPDDVTEPTGKKDQENRIREAEEIMSELVRSYGYKKVRVPENVSERENVGLKLQLLSAKGDFEGFSRFTISLSKAGFSKNEIISLNAIANLNIDSSKKQEICDKLLMSIFERD